MLFVCLGLLALLAAQQYLHQRERERLLKLRFQHRDVVPVLPTTEEEPPAWVAPDDDKGHFEAVKERS